MRQTDSGLAIVTADGTYLVAGADLIGLVGQHVMATGTVTPTEAGKIITVTSVEQTQIKQAFPDPVPQARLL